MKFLYIIICMLLFITAVVVYIKCSKSETQNNYYIWDGKSIECEKCKEDVELVQVTGDAKKFFVYVRKEKDFISNAIKTTGDWHDCKQMKELWFSLPGLTKDDYYMDAGANIGICSMDMLNLGIKTIAVEPIPNNLHLLTKSILYNKEWIKNFILFKVGLSNKEETQTINIEKGNWGGSSLINLNQNYKTEKVHITTLDKLLHNFKHRIHFASVDIQGYELFMLEGGIEVLKRKTIRHFYMEIWCSVYKKINITEDDVYNFFEKYNYVIKNKRKCNPSTDFFDIIVSSNI